MMTYRQIALILCLVWLPACADEGKTNSTLNSSDQKQEISVLNFNTFLLNGTGTNNYTDERIMVLPNQLAALSADVVILQEVWQQDHRDFLTTEMEKQGYPYAIFYEGDRDASANWGSYGNGLLILSKFEPAGAPRFQAWTNWTRILERKSTKGIMSIDLKLPNGKVFTVANAHTSTKQFKDGSYKDSHIEKRLVQINQIVDLLAGVRSQNGGAPIVLGIDLNSHPYKWDPQQNEFSSEYSKEYRTLVDALNLSDSFHEINGDNVSYTYDKNSNSWIAKGFFTDEPSAILDYILTSKDQVEIVDSQMVLTEEHVFSNALGEAKGPLSDHYGILSTLQL